jgi:predicted AlkP superfamily phosphohydrolase/phosphomutase
MRAGKKRLFVLGIDGVPYSLVQEAFHRGLWPNFQRLARQGHLAMMSSVLPVVSSVAWATFSTGVNPARHGIFGFVDRDSELRPVVLTASHLKAKSLWRRLNEHSKRVIAINVPGTYPPEPIEGILIGDFLSPSLEKATYPSALLPLLHTIGYVIDPEPHLALTDKAAFVGEIFRALQAREELTLRLLESEEWDFFMLHVMETDRMNHFFWDAKEDPEHVHHDKFWEFYGRLDELIGHVMDALDAHTELMILSDHGFCGIRYDVDLNCHLAEQGLLRFELGANALSDLEPSSVAYSLTPGRIYANLPKGEAQSSVAARDRTRWLRELTNALYELKDPQDGGRVIERVYTREEIYRGPLLSQAAELIAYPRNGYDLKAGTQPTSLFSNSPRTGMHTYDEALIYVRGHTIRTDRPISILDMAPTILQLLGLEIPAELEGRSVLVA